MPRALHAVASRYERADGASPRRRTGEPHADILRFAAIVGFCCFRRRRAGRRGAKWEPSGLWGLGVAIRGGGRRSGDIPWRRMSRDAGAKRRCPVPEMSRDAARSGSPAVCGATGQRFVAEARDGDALWRRMSRGAGAKWRCPVPEMSRDAGAKWEPSGLRGLGVAIRGGGAGWALFWRRNRPLASRGCAMRRRWVGCRERARAVTA